MTDSELPEADFELPDWWYRLWAKIARRIADEESRVIYPPVE